MSAIIETLLGKHTPKIKVPAPLMVELNKILEKQNLTIDTNVVSTHTISIQMGKLLESVFEYRLKEHWKDNPKINYFKGEDIQKQITEGRKLKGEASKEFERYLIEEYFFTPEYSHAILTDKTKKNSIPDSILVDKTSDKPLVIVGELKSAGPFDSTKLPGEALKMTHRIKNSAVEPWFGKENICLERYIFVAATDLTSTKKWARVSAWTNYLTNKIPGDGLKLKCNQEIWEVLTKQKTSAVQYNKEVLETIATIMSQEIINIKAVKSMGQ